MNNKMKLVLGMFLMILNACGSSTSSTGPQGVVGQVGANGAQGTQGIPGVNAATPTPTPVESQIQSMVDSQNAERSVLGQEPLTEGLTCTLYTIPTATTAIIGATGLVNVGSFKYAGVFNQSNESNTNGLNILPVPLQSVYQNWYIVKCTGYLVVVDNNYHEFDLDTDDGSNLYVDGLLINNDGLHAAQDKSSTKFLGYGFHSFELDYFQGGGNEALILNEDGAVMQSNGFYH